MHINEIRTVWGALENERPAAACPIALAKYIKKHLKRTANSNLARRSDKQLHIKFPEACTDVLSLIARLSKAFAVMRPVLQVSNRESSIAEVGLSSFGGLQQICNPSQHSIPSSLAIQ